MRPVNYSPNCRPEHEGYRSADHSTRPVGTAGAVRFASPSDEVPETGQVLLTKAGLTAPVKFKKSK